MATVSGTSVPIPTVPKSTATVNRSHSKMLTKLEMSQFDTESEISPPPPPSPADPITDAEKAAVAATTSSSKAGKTAVGKTGAHLPLADMSFNTMNTSSAAFHNKPTTFSRSRVSSLACLLPLLVCGTILFFSSGLLIGIYVVPNLVPVGPLDGLSQAVCEFQDWHANGTLVLDYDSRTGYLTTSIARRFMTMTGFWETMQHELLVLKSTDLYRCLYRGKDAEKGFKETDVLNFTPPGVVFGRTGVSHIGRLASVRPGGIEDHKELGLNKQNHSRFLAAELLASEPNTVPVYKWTRLMGQAVAIAKRTKDQKDFETRSCCIIVRPDVNDQRLDSKLGPRT